MNDMNARKPVGQLSETERGKWLERSMVSTGQVVVEADRDLRILWANESFYRLTGLSAAEVIGRQPQAIWRDFVRGIFYEPIRRCLAEKKAVQKIGYSNVFERWMLIQIFPVGQGLLMLASEAQSELVRQTVGSDNSFVDVLTRLGNRQALEKDLRARMNGGEHFFLVMLGLERIDQINNAHGYAFGDVVLMEVCERIRGSSAAKSKLYRSGGNVFSIVQSGESPNEAALERLLALLEEPIVVGQHIVAIGAHAGFAAYPKDGSTADNLVQRASIARRGARQGSGKGVLGYDRALEDAIRARATLHAEVRQALAHEELEIYLQPKIDLADFGVVGAEALLRWRHPSKGVLGPGDLLEAARELGLMTGLDKWVMSEVATLCQTMKMEGCGIPISVNLSAETLADASFVSFVDELLRERAVDPCLIEVEIPEGDLMVDAHISEQVLAELQDMGVKTSIDDFGTGYSSFAYLARYRVKALKIDRSFVASMMESEASRLIVQKVVQLAHAMNLRVVAEGAEDAAQVKTLKRLKCDEVQGFAISKAVPLREFMSFNAAWDQRLPVH